MEVPYFRAKSVRGEHYYEGFFFEMPSTYYCFTEDYVTNPVELIPYLLVCSATDWGLPNQANMVRIDRTTLVQIGTVDTSKAVYDPKKFIKPLKS